MTHDEEKTTDDTASQEWTFGPVPPVARAVSPYRARSEAEPVVDTAPPAVVDKGGNPLLGLMVGVILGGLVVLLSWGLHVQIGSGIRLAVPLAVLGLRLLVQPRR